VVSVGYLGCVGCWCFVCVFLLSFFFSGVSAWVVGNLGCVLVDVELLAAMIVSLSVLLCCALFLCCFHSNVFCDVAELCCRGLVSKVVVAGFRVYAEL